MWLCTSLVNFFSPQLCGEISRATQKAVSCWNRKSLLFPIWVSDLIRFAKIREQRAFFIPSSTKRQRFQLSHWPSCMDMTSLWFSNRKFKRFIATWKFMTPRIRSENFLEALFVASSTKLWSTSSNNIRVVWFETCCHWHFLALAKRKIYSFVTICARKRAGSLASDKQRTSGKVRRRIVLRIEL